MISLLELQQAFADAVFGKEESPCPAQCVCRQELPETAFGIYRSSVLGNYRKTLGAVYPVVERLVGERFFAHAADAFARRTPSCHGDLNRYGEEFADFLAGFPGAQGLAYLPDVARLEWAVDAVFNAADPCPPNLALLTSLAESGEEGVTFLLGDHCRLLRSPWPVDRLWALNQPGVAWDEGFSIDSGPVALLVRREGYDCAIEPLQESEFALLAALNDGLSVAAACARPESPAPERCGESLALRLAQGVLRVAP